MEKSVSPLNNAPDSLTLSYIDSFGTAQLVEMSELNPVITIGSKPECSIMAVNDTAAPIHTIVIFKNGRIFVQDIVKKTPKDSTVVDGWTLPPGLEMEIQNTFTSCHMDFYIQKESKPLDDAQKTNIANSIPILKQSSERYSSPANIIAQQNNSYSPADDIAMQTSAYSSPLNEMNKQNNINPAPINDINQNNYSAPANDINLQNNIYSAPANDINLQNNIYSAPANDIMQNNAFAPAPTNAPSVPNRYSSNRMPPVPVQDCMETGIYQGNSAVKFFYQDEHNMERCFILDSQQPTAIIGRHPDCQIRTLNESVSRHHALLTWVNGRVFIEDPPNGHARNGVRVDSMRLQQGKKIELPAICSIFCGNCEIRVESSPIGQSPIAGYSNRIGYQAAPVPHQPPRQRPASVVNQPPVPTNDREIPPAYGHQTRHPWDF